MNRKNLQEFCKKPIIKDKRMIGKVIYEMAMMPVPYLYHQGLTSKYNGKKTSLTESSIRSISDILLFHSNGRKDLYGYEALQKCDAMQLFSSTMGLFLKDEDEWWALWLLSRIHSGFAIDMEKGVVLGIKK